MILPPLITIYTDLVRRSRAKAPTMLVLLGPLHDEVRALLAVLRFTLVAIEHAGLLVDDQGELAVAVLARWSVGEATAEEVKAEQHLLLHGTPRQRGRAARLRRTFACAFSDTAQFACSKRPSRRPIWREGVLRSAAFVVFEATGTPMEDAEAQVQAIYNGTVRDDVTGGGEGARRPGGERE